MVHVIQGNTKIGKTANVSLPPGLGCVNSEKCFASCYAVKFYQMYPGVKRAWDDNLKEVLFDQECYFNGIRRYLLRHIPAYFRWHISGDILDQEYLERMKEIASDYKFVSFLVFTKNYSLLFGSIPVNLSVIISVWEGLKVPDLSFPKAFVTGQNVSSSNDCVTCPGSCETCRVCWTLGEIKQDVMLLKH